MTFSYDLTTPVGQLRLAIGDVSPQHGVKPDGNPFADEELAVFVSQEAGLLNATARVCETLAVWYARAVNNSTGVLQQSLSDIAARYDAEGKQLRLRAIAAGYTTDSSGAALLPTPWLASGEETAPALARRDAHGEF